MRRSITGLTLLLCLALLSCNSPASVSLSWTESTPGVTSYSVYRSLHGQNSYSILSVVSATRYTDMAVSLGKSYDYYVIATDAGGSSPRSNVVTATIP